MRTNYLTEDPQWVYFYPKFNSSFYVEKASYFDERPRIVTSVTQLLLLFLLPFLVIQSFWFLMLIPFVFLGWGKLAINLPIKTGIQDCDSSAYGFNYHNNTIWIYVGGAGNFDGGRKWITITMPWEKTWVRTSTKLKNGKWFNETRKNRLNWSSNEDGIHEVGSYEWLRLNKWNETHPFIDFYDGTVVNATISIVEREWRPLWFTWTNLFSFKRRVIEVEFNQEVGARKGQWKGGTVSCSYDLLPTESPYECLKRMELKRKF